MITTITLDNGKVITGDLKGLETEEGVVVLDISTGHRRTTVVPVSRVVSAITRG